MTDTIPMLDLARLHKPLHGELTEAFRDTLESGRFIGGPNVERFEQALAAHVGAAHAVGVSSGTDALLVTLMALDVKPGDEVITTPYTFFATAGSIWRLGARPVFIDIDPITFNIDPSEIERAITGQTVGIIPVHLFGQCADMEPVLKLAEDHGLWVIEDSAQAIGAKYSGRPAGTMGTAGAFSFFPAKNLGALGDSGAVVTDDAALAEKVRILVHHGARQKYHHDTVGGNFRLDALQAALLLAKLPSLNLWEEGRRRNAGRYLELLSDLPGLKLPKESAGHRHVFNQFVIRHQKRDAVQGALRDADISSAIYYPRPLHLQECFASLNYKEGDFTQAERAASDSLAIPIDPNLDERGIEKIARVIRKTIQSDLSQIEAR